jgi:hypothetical protein
MAACAFTTFCSSSRHATSRSRSLIPSQWTASTSRPGGAFSATYTMAPATTAIGNSSFSTLSNNALTLQKVPGKEGSREEATRRSWDTIAMSSLFAMAASGAIVHTNTVTNLESSPMATSVATLPGSPLVSSSPPGEEHGKILIRGNVRRRVSSRQSQNDTIQLPKEESKLPSNFHFRRASATECEPERKEELILDILSSAKPYEVRDT